MSELLLSRLHEWLIILYAISLVLYFIDYLNKDRMAHKLAFIVHCTAYAMQTFTLIYTIFETKQFPVLSLFDGIYIYAWLLMSLSIVVHLWAKMNYFMFLLNVIGFIFITIHTFAPMKVKESTLAETLISELLIIHISFAFLAYVAFAMTFVCAILHFMLYRNLKQKKWSKQFGRLPSLQQTAKMMKTGMIVGIPFLAISLILGVQWAFIVLTDWSLFDIKIIGSFFILITYSVILYLYQRGKLIGNDYAWMNILAFLIVIINFFLGSTLSQFHFWI